MRYSLSILLICLVFGLNAQNWGGKNRVRGNGEVTTEQRDVKSFDGIKVCCSIKVEVTQGSSASVTVEAESNILPYVKTDVMGGYLQVGFTGKASINSTKPIIVKVTAPSLEYIGASSSSKVVSTSTFSGDELELDASSSGKIYFNFSGDLVRADA
ncbi:MAG: DUF2807 domain-containing protein, partial [Bacteroidota bacterium]